jgi:hypothetical protein
MKKLTLLIPVAASALLMMGCQDLLCLAPPGTKANTKLTICSPNGKSGKFKLITVSAAAAAAHVELGGFLAPAGAKKDKDCVVPTTPDEPVVEVPPVVVDPGVVIPPVVVDPGVVVPPVVDEPVVEEPVVVPPTTVDPTPGPGTSDGGGSGGSEGEEEEEEGPGAGGSDGDTEEPVTGNPIVIEVPLDCVLNPLHVDCAL